MKRFLRESTMYRGLPETEHVRKSLEVVRRHGWPSCPADEGDLLFQLAKSVGDQHALEVGFATGSTAAYILFGLGTGQLTSIDYDQNHYERAGEQLVASLGFAGRHRLIEQDSIRALPALYETGARYGLVFLDGWKTFDHLWVDTFYCARMLNRGGFMVFDDAHLPAVRKSISLLTRYYGFRDIHGDRLVGGVKQRVWHLLSTRSMRRPYVALNKVMNVEETEAGRKFDFWKRF